MLRLVIILVLGSVVFSCTPETYSYYPAQRRINHTFSLQDTIHVIFPYASFKVIGEGENELSRDNLRARLIEEMSNSYLLKHFTERFGADQLDDADYERDSLGFQFGTMIRYFYEKKEKHYFLKIDSKKNGYALIFGADWQLRDYKYWVGMRGYSKGGSGHKPRLLTFSYLCLFNLQTGEVLDYNYFFGPLGVPFDRENLCEDELLMKKKIEKNLDHASRRLLRKSKK